ncbi:MAG: hypothetical protein DMD36_16065 [Gemmatimonadetes bacterium]|nr:MAG: hypothetical protein DMD36_16065 [Gemmatimonadota bacterium]
MRLGLTQVAFAPRLGITANSLARLERGERGVSETLALLAQVVAQEAPARRRKRRR